MKHLWIIKRDSSTMLLYHSFDNPPFKAMIVSGLLAAMYNFSKVEIQERGIQSIEMYDLRWTYLSAEDDNLLIIGADSKEQNSEIMRARLQVIMNTFIDKYHIKLKYWENSAYDLEVFLKFKNNLKELKHEWELTGATKDLGNIFDLLYIFQDILQIFINFIIENFHSPLLDRILKDLLLLSPQLKEWNLEGFNPEAFQILHLYIPQIDLAEKKIYFNKSAGHSLIQRTSIGFEPDDIKSFFIYIIQYYIKIVKGAIPDLTWNTFVVTSFIPFFIRKWEYLDHLGILKESLYIITSHEEEL